MGSGLFHSERLSEDEPFWAANIQRPTSNVELENRESFDVERSMLDVRLQWVHGKGPLPFGTAR